MGVKKEEIKLQYGLRGNTLVYIGDIIEEEKGLKCNCICPSCKTPLQARMGNIRQRHFSHNNSNCNSAIAQQTALHLLAKEIIEEERTVKFPSYNLSYQDVGIEDYHLLDSYPCTESMIVEFDTVKLETRISNIVPDVIVKKGEKECLIEIAVTHFVDEEKKKKIREIGLPMLEIDLSDCKGSIERSRLTELIKNEIKNKKWISNPNVFEKYKDKAREWFQNQIEQFNREQEKIHRELQEAKKREQEKFEYLQRKNIAVKQNIQNAFLPENYSHIIMSLRDDNKALLEFQKTKMFKEGKEMPFYFDIPIKGEFIFNCDRRIWQMILFDKFIYNRKKEGTAIIVKNKSIKDYFVKHIKSEKGYNLINWDYYSTDISDDNLLWTVIDKYLKKLHDLGLVAYTEVLHQTVINQVHNIIPQDKNFEELLKKTMVSVDCFSIDAAEKIDEYISQNLNW